MPTLGTHKNGAKRGYKWKSLTSPLGNVLNSNFMESLGEKIL